MVHDLCMARSEVVVKLDPEPFTQACEIIGRHFTAMAAELRAIQPPAQPMPEAGERDA